MIKFDDTEIEEYKFYQSKRIIKFGDAETDEYKFHQNKKPILVNYTDINKIVVSNKLPFSKQDFKYFIGYKVSEKIRPLCICHSQMIIYKINFDENKHVYFFYRKGKVVDKYMVILEKVSNIIKNKFNSKFICNEEYLDAEKNKQKRRLSRFIYRSNIGWFSL